MKEFFLSEASPHRDGRFVGWPCTGMCDAKRGERREDREEEARCLLDWDLASGISGNKEEKNTASRLGFFTASTVPCNDIPYGYDIR